MSVPLWVRPPKSDSIVTDVAIIGGGIAGLSCALACKDRGIDALVIERHNLGWGASRRNAGYLMRGAADNYAAAVETYGRDTARELWSLTEQNLEGLLLRGIEAIPSCAHCPSCLLALTQEEETQLRKSRTLLEEDGFAVEWLDSHTDTAWQSRLPRCGLVNPNDRTINPAQLIEHLAKQLPVSPLTDAEVYAITDQPSDPKVRTSRGDISARRVILCTNAHLNRLIPQSRAWVQPNRAQMLAINAGARSLDFAYYANHGGEYFRQPDPQRIVVGGKRLSHADEERTESDAISDGVQGELERFARSILGDPIEVTARWAGTMGFTRDHLPLAGPIEAGGPTYICAGFNGHGASMAHETARRLIESVSDAVPPPFPLDRAGLQASQGQ